MKSSFIIAAPYSGSGKTTVTIGILRALHNRGLNVQPFKCGPDYLDPFHHEVAANRYSYNLDVFMSSEEHVRQVFFGESLSANVSVVEGAMGMFDGANSSNGSAAHLAKVLDIPVVLIVDARAMAYSAAPLLYGFKNFDKDIRIAGVIFNFVKTESHYSFLKQAAQDVGITALGYLLPNSDIKIESRYLGLQIDDKELYEHIVEKASKHIEAHINLDLLLKSTQTTHSVKVDQVPLNDKKIKIAIARDEAFNFFYRRNIKQFEQVGQIVYFSPLYDQELPDVDFVYFAGGYPELYLEQLSANVSMRESIKKYVEAGGKLLAECGGMMYLGSQIINNEGKGYDMAGVFNYSTSLQDSKLSLGYRTVNYNGETIKGHEFHYSKYSCLDSNTTTAEVLNAKGVEVNSPVFKFKNAVASYIHFYWGEVDVFKVFSL